MKVLHSCCAGKRDINAPEFELIAILCSSTKSKPIMEWKCKGCQTVIYVVREAKDES